LPTRALARKPYRRSSIRQQPRIYRGTGDQWVNKCCENDQSTKQKRKSNWWLTCPIN